MLTGLPQDGDGAAALGRGHITQLLGFADQRKVSIMEMGWSRTSARRERRLAFAALLI